MNSIFGVAGGLLLALALLSSAACQTERETDAPGTAERGDRDLDLETEADLEPTGDLGEAGEQPVVTSQFQPGEGAAGQDVQGTLRILPAGDNFQAEARVEGLSEGEHAWHVHSAPCGQKGPVVVAFTPTKEMEGTSGALDAGSDGVAEGTAEIPADQLSRQQIESGAYSIHVHAQGGVDHGPTVACANI